VDHPDATKNKQYRVDKGISEIKSIISDLAIGQPAEGQNGESND